MADWLTHLYCAEKVNKDMGFSGEKLELFFFGNLLPDVNPGWLIAPKVEIEQAITHFEAGITGQGYFWSPQRFFEKYESKIREKNPIYLGYMFHLWLDVAFMTDFVSRVRMSDMVMNGEEAREWKWKDLAFYISKKTTVFLNGDIAPMVVAGAEGIEETDISEEDIRKIPGFLEDVKKGETETGYRIYSDEELTDFFERVCSDFSAWVKTI